MPFFAILCRAWLRWRLPGEALIVFNNKSCIQDVQMPKMKTHSGASKRFKKTGSGKVKRGFAFHRHILTSKATKRKRQMDMGGMVDKADLPKI